MEILKLKFWFDLSLVILTSYVFIWYIFSPSQNQCQMTFMMEPPRFIPVPLEETARDSELNYPQAKLDGPLQNNEGYKLYMYSELGFPQTSNINRDLKDSMPVLFVPGNAGSFQQVRSLASTCIRRQLQSLDAYKFIFYTIDFRGQLSAVDGKLIEEQTEFVHRSMIQISKLHPVDTKGIILVGHSIGGFISKYLFTRPKFDPSSVPLVISLASPLTEPYLIFDDKMRVQYNKANQLWMEKESRFNETLAISISGGEIDRLVPTHLSMDPFYDLSVSTSSIKNVWIETDHVCITWCRELMHKLAHLLSALMDKKRIQLITDKVIAMSIIKEELLVNQTNTNNKETTVIHRDWKTTKQHQVMKVEDFLSITRSQLSNNIIILDLTNLKNNDLLIVIDHIDSLKTNAMFGCKDIDLNSETGQVNCFKRVDMMHLGKLLPTRRFEPKKTVIKVFRDPNFEQNFIILDFLINVKGLRNVQEGKVPELITIQEIDLTEERQLYIPTLIEFIFSQIFFLDDYKHIFKPIKSLPSTYTRFEIINLKKNTQLFRVSYKTSGCQNTERPFESVVIQSQNGFLSRSFHPEYERNDESYISMKLSPYTTILSNMTDEFDKKTYLEMFIDGTCIHSLEVKLDFMNLVVSNIQRNLGKILAFATYFTYQSIVFHSFNLINQKVELKYYTIQHLLTFTGFVILNYANSYSPRSPLEEVESDRLISFLLLNVSALGVVAYLKYVIKRILDLAAIINNVQSFLRLKCSRITINGATIAENSTLNNSVTSGSSKFIQNEITWLLIMIAITGSLIFSAAILSLFKIFSVIKLKLSLDSSKSELDHGCSNNKHCSLKIDKNNFKLESEISNLSISIAVFCALAFISNIPVALTRINRFNSISALTESAYKEVYFIASAVSLILIKMISEQIELLFKQHLEYTSQKEEKRLSVNQVRSTFQSSKLHRVLHLTILMPILLIESNICNIILALFTCLSWLYCYMLKINSLQLGLI